MAVTGAAGMLGQEVCRAAPGWATVTALTREHGDLAVVEQAREAFLVASPRIIIHCAACADVDGCTRDPDRAWADNALATGNVAQAANELGALALYVSTDYIFDGTKGAPYLEDDEPNPLNIYGESKLAGEDAIRELAEHVIVRTQWLHGLGGGNFVASILRAAADGRDLRVVEDEIGSPTYAPDLADGIWRLLESGARGIFHLVGQGSCSRHELARAALDEVGMMDIPVSRMLSADWDSPTVRPLDTRLGDSRLAEAGVEHLRPWREALAEYVKLFE